MILVEVDGKCQLVADTNDGGRERKERLKHHGFYYPEGRTFYLNANGSRAWKC